MLSRKTFILLGIASAAALTSAYRAMGRKVRPTSAMNKKKPARALVVWYSQTGNTERVGRAVAAAWKKQGIAVDQGDYRDIDRDSLDKYDIIAAGSPVYYYEVPENFRRWLEGMPRIDGTPVAAFITFGGKGGNTRNTACELAGLLAQKGGVPAGTAGFGCMGAWSVAWPFSSREKLLQFSDRPNADTFSAAQKFAGETLARAARGEAVEVSGEFDSRNLIKGGPSIGGTKLMMAGHRVNREKCVNCGKCQRACTVNAIDPSAGTVDTGRCIVCLGCVNNCPTGAVEVKFMGRDVYGHAEFLKRFKIVRAEPEA